jgi:hypothetical protein
LPLCKTNLERADLELKPKNQAIYQEEAPAYLPDENKILKSSNHLKSINQHRNINFRVSPVRFIIPEIDTSPLENSFNNYFAAKSQESLIPNLN